MASPHLDISETEREEPLSFVLEGCSWGCIFYCGIWEALKDQYTDEEISTMRFGGSSSGTIAALGACLNRSTKEVLDLYKELSHVALEFGVVGYMSIYHEIVLRRWLPPGGNEWEKCVNRLFVNVTRFFRTSEVISDWTSNQDIIDAMHASMHIPYYMTYLHLCRGRMGIDGGLSANTFHIDANSIIVTASSRKGDIFPDVPLTNGECFSPPQPERQMSIVKQASQIPIREIVKKKRKNNIEVENKIIAAKPAFLVKRALRLALTSVAWTLRFAEPYGYGALPMVLTGLALCSKAFRGGLVKTLGRLYGMKCIAR